MRVGRTAARACLRLNNSSRRHVAGVAGTPGGVTSEQLQLCVPESSRVSTEAVADLLGFVQEHRSICVLSGAGLSTESGIPDYRSEKVGHFARSNYRPLLYQDFLKNEHVRRRYWARNYLAYAYFSTRQPNAAHLGVRRLEQLGKCTRIITQNVDGLQQKAGSTQVLELHGAASRVVCVGCGRQTERAELQHVLAAANAGWIKESEILHVGSASASASATEQARLAVTITPDGDVQFNDATQIARFSVPSCASCGGVLRAHVVFHGDNMPAEVRRAADQYVDDCDSLLVLGSSLTVQSAFRLVARACAAQKRVAIVNVGPTRADSLVLMLHAHRRNLKLPFRISELLAATLRRLETTNTSTDGNTSS